MFRAWIDKNWCTWVAFVSFCCCEEREEPVLAQKPARGSPSAATQFQGELVTEWSRCQCPPCKVPAAQLWLFCWNVNYSTRCSLLLQFRFGVTMQGNVLTAVLFLRWFPSAGVYKPEPLGDMWWALLSNGILFVYHFSFLQLLGLVRCSPLLAVKVYRSTGKGRHCSLLPRGIITIE